MTAVFQKEDGTTFERSRIVLMYPRILSDAEQFPFVMAGELRAMMQADEGWDASRIPLA